MKITVFAWIILDLNELDTYFVGRGSRVTPTEEVLSRGNIDVCRKRLVNGGIMS